MHSGTGLPEDSQTAISAVCLYEGTVVHRRLRPLKHRLVYRVFWLLVDLDRLASVRGRFAVGPLPLLGVDGPGLISFHQRDHGDGRTDGLADWVREQMRQHGLADVTGPIRLLAMPRVLGGVFNPLSVYFCHRQDGALAAILYQVNNTFGDRHSYLVPAIPGADGLARASVGKTFHVSPFLALEGAYHFRTLPPGESVAVGIHQTDGQGQDILHAALSARRAGLSVSGLLAVWLRHPLLSLKVLGGIHWEALRLWRKGAPFFRRQPPPDQAVTLTAVSPDQAPGAAQATAELCPERSAAGVVVASDGRGR